MEKYKVSTTTHYCHENDLYYTYVGLNDENMTLLATVWGETEVISRNRAEMFVHLLEKS